MNDLERIVAKTLIVHAFPKKGSVDRTGTLADTASPLVANVPHFFEERVKLAVTRYGLDIAFQEGSTSPTPATIHGLLTKPKTAQRFAKASRDLATHLFAHAQSTRTDGLFCMLRFEVSAKQLIAVIKLEYEEGTRAVLAGAAGNRHYDIQHVVDLMLTRNTKVFKVAIFCMKDGGTDIDNIEGRICDYQSGKATIADYFIADFLGCRLTEQANLLTETFLDVAERFINDTVKDPTIRAQYETAILAELNSNVPKVKPRDLAMNHFAQEYRQPFLNRLTESAVPLTVFNKDVSLIKSRISRVMFDFGQKKIMVTTPPDEIGKAVTISEDENGLAHLSVTAKLTSTKGAK